MKRLDDGTINGANIIADIHALADVAEEVMGGTSGSLYSIFFSGLASALNDSGATEMSTAVWSECLQAALANLYKCTFFLAHPETC